MFLYACIYPVHVHIPPHVCDVWFIPIDPIFKTEWFLWRRPLVIVIHKIYVFVLIIYVFT